MNHLPPAPPEPAPATGRPHLHFTPPGGWLNDPNGLVYLDGEFHLFYQHHPDSLVWGPMHWGHAVSRDLVRWEHLPIALAPDELGMIFSGSAVIDSANTAGFGAGALVAIFTHDGAGRQVQSLAWSSDRGRNWTKYAGNPVLAPADAPTDFRDPRVLWYAGPGGGHWVMLLAVGREVWLYTSPDLKAWTKTSVFGPGYGAHSGVWECPELVCLPVDGGPEQRWVLAVGVQQGAPAGGSGTQYFVGDFDGGSFTSDDPPGTVRWADYGADFYAAQAWQNAPGARTLWLAWMNNWDYARATPAGGWRGMMSVPRELALTREAGEIVLVQRFPAELTAAWPALCSLQDATVDGTLALDAVAGATLLIEATFAVTESSASVLGLRLRASEVEAATVGYDVARQELFVARGAVDGMADGFGARQVAPLRPRDGRVELRVLVDATAIEILADDGRVALASQIFPAGARPAVELFAEGGAGELATLRVWAPER